ncbi:protein smoothened [Teleopsis dalmanni]|uniref:protein smoothened n=1 Tax=Teleopsis dalmanni TaxID=139649 RepID=UPI0018CF2395|nr:protein smoothened [Teleopsis dalmanni]
MLRTSFLLHAVCAALFFGFGYSAIAGVGAPSTSLQTDLERINGTVNYRIYGKNGKDDKPWVVGRSLDVRHIQCVRRGHCERLTQKTCFNAKIPYEYTSSDLTDYQSQDQVLKHLESYRAIRNVPKCWSVIQPFLCAVFFPKCEQINGKDMVYLPSLEMCRITLEPCRILYNTTYFPEFLRCNETLFPPKCSNDVREMKFNITGQCLSPLVSADTSASYYPGIEGCGVQCKDPLYTNDEHQEIHKLVGWGGTLCFLANLFVVATFLIDWENANKYPALIVFYINLCFLIASFGWLAQFTPGSHEDIVCRKDGTLRHSEPTAGENLSCVVVFVLIYYFLTAAMVWFVFLTYTWHLRAVGNVQDRIDKKGSYFHLVAWSMPLVLTITTMALSEVDGNSIVGICFVGYLNHSIRAGLLLGPLCCVVLVGGYFVIRGMIMLFGLKHFANDIQSTSASNKIHLIIVRMGLCALFTLIFILVILACHITEFRHSNDWAESLRKYVICRISSDEHTLCKIENRPSVAVLQLHLLCLFGSGIVMSTWCWTSSSIETWKRYIKKSFGKEVVEDVKMPKHKVIAQTWAKRKEFEDKGRLSITLYNTHTDPVGLNFDLNDLNSSETNEISSTWANYLPQFVKRRMALTGAGIANSSSQGARKNSLDSEISFSMRHVSVESRRNSDSQVSVKIAEMKTKIASRSRNSHHQHNKQGTSTSKRSQRRRDFIASASGHKYSVRRESSTSIESQVIALKKTTFPNSSHKVGLFTHSTKKHNSNSSCHKNMKRRTANAGLNPADINDFLGKNGQLILPFLQNAGMTTSSDGETSRSSFKDANKHKAIAVIPMLRQNEDDMKIMDVSDLNLHLQRNLDHEGDSLSSYGSDELDIPLNIILNSSYSSMSLGKPNSRNSKTSCDVGIQADAYEIATQTMKQLNRKSDYKTEACEAIEMHSLLNSNRHKEAMILSESERLKMLLLPSK